MNMGSSPGTRRSGIQDEAVVNADDAQSRRPPLTAELQPLDEDETEVTLEI